MRQWRKDAIKWQRGWSGASPADGRRYTVTLECRRMGAIGIFEKRRFHVTADTPADATTAAGLIADEMGFERNGRHWIYDVARGAWFGNVP
jgi:hypothetical protein